MGRKKDKKAKKEKSEKKEEPAPPQTPPPPLPDYDEFGRDSERVPADDSNAKEDVKMQEVADESHTTVPATESGRSEVRTTKTLPSIVWSEAPQLPAACADDDARADEAPAQEQAAEEPKEPEVEQPPAEPEKAAFTPISWKSKKAAPKLTPMGFGFGAAEEEDAAPDLADGAAANAAAAGPAAAQPSPAEPTPVPSVLKVVTPGTLPPTWKRIPSQSRPGEYSYKHLRTGLKQSKFPDCEPSEDEVIAYFAALNRQRVKKGLPEVFPEDRAPPTPKPKQPQQTQLSKRDLKEMQRQMAAAAPPKKGDKGAAAAPAAATEEPGADADGGPPNKKEKLDTAVKAG